MGSHFSTYAAFICCSSLIDITLGATYNLYASVFENNCTEMGVNSNDTCIMHCDTYLFSDPTFDCGHAGSCVFECEEKRCAWLGSLNATNVVNNVTINSFGISCFEHFVVNVTNYGNAYFNAIESRTIRENLVINAGTNTNEMIIDCTSGNMNECEAMKINAQTAQYLEVKIGAGSEFTGDEKTMEAGEINCPEDSNYSGPETAPCIIDVSEGGSMNYVNIWAKDGMPNNLFVKEGAATMQQVTIACSLGSSENNGENLSSETCWITSDPTKSPEASNHNPTSAPTPSSTPTPAPTSNPTLRPTRNPTERPTPNPTEQPTANPLSADVMQCGTINAGYYSGGILEIMVHMAHEGDLTFDASESDFANRRDTIEIWAYEVFILQSDVLLSVSSGLSAIMTLADIQSGNYRFVIDLYDVFPPSGYFDIRISCTTPNPTYEPTLNPTKTPTTAPNVPTLSPTKHPITSFPTPSNIMQCGMMYSDQYYQGDLLSFMVYLPYEGDLTFDATASSFLPYIRYIYVYTESNTLLVTDADRDGILTLSNVTAGYYRFIVDHTYRKNVDFYHIQISCASKNPTTAPTSKPTQTPTVTTLAPSDAPTKEPTSSPTNEPTPFPTSFPSSSDTLECGVQYSGTYDYIMGAELLFMVYMPYEGTLVFDATESNYFLNDILQMQASTALNTVFDEDKDGIITLTNIPAGNYQFMIETEVFSSGMYIVQISCASNNPTAAPTTIPSTSPSNNPTKAPISDPTYDPTTAPSKNPISSAIPTNKPTSAPAYNPVNGSTDEPTSAPNKNPTDDPTGDPTIGPTLNPTSSPNTLSTTFRPISAPLTTPAPNVATTTEELSTDTVTPTLLPSKCPTAPPSDPPTDSPSDDPTVSPTKILRTDDVDKVSTTYTVCVDPCNDSEESDGCIFKQQSIRQAARNAFSNDPNIVVIVTRSTVNQRTVCLDITVVTDEDAVLSEDALEDEIEDMLQDEYENADVDAEMHSTSDVNANSNASSLEMDTIALVLIILVGFLCCVIICGGVGVFVFTKHWKRKHAVVTKNEGLKLAMSALPSVSPQTDAPQNVLISDDDDDELEIDDIRNDHMMDGLRGEGMEEVALPANVASTAAYRKEEEEEDDDGMNREMDEVALPQHATTTGGYRKEEELCVENDDADSDGDIIKAMNVTPGFNEDGDADVIAAVNETAHGRVRDMDIVAEVNETAGNQNAEQYDDEDVLNIINKTPF